MFPYLWDQKQRAWDETLLEDHPEKASPDQYGDVTDSQMLKMGYYISISGSS